MPVQGSNSTARAGSRSAAADSNKQRSLAKSPLKGVAPVKDDDAKRDQSSTNGITLPPFPRRRSDSSGTMQVSSPGRSYKTSQLEHLAPKATARTAPHSSPGPPQQPLQPTAAATTITTAVSAPRRATGIARLKALAQRNSGGGSSSHGGDGQQASGVAAHTTRPGTPSRGPDSTDGDQFAQQDPDSHSEGTRGFESPDRPHELQQIAKEEVRWLLKRQQQRIAGLGQDAANSGGRRVTDDLDMEELDQADIPKQHATGKRAGADAGYSEPLAEQRSCGDALPRDQIDHITRDVAARIIQTYWRNWRAWRMQLRLEAEERTLQQLLGQVGGLPPSVLQVLQRPATAAATATALSPRRQHHEEREAGAEAEEEEEEVEVDQAPPRRYTHADAVTVHPGSTGQQARQRSKSDAGDGLNRSSKANSRSKDAGSHVPRAYRPSAADLEVARAADTAGGMQLVRQKSIPGGHTVYTVSAAPSRRVTNSSSSISGGARPEADASDVPLRQQRGQRGQQPAARAQSAASRRASEAGSATSRGSHMGREASWGDDEEQHSRDWADDGRDQLQSSHAAASDQGDGRWARVRGSRSQDEDVERGGDGGGVHELLARLAAGEVPEGMQPEDLQVLLQVLQQSKSQGKLSTGGVGSEVDDDDVHGEGDSDGGEFEQGYVRPRGQQQQQQQSSPAAPNQDAEVEHSISLAVKAADDVAAASTAESRPATRQQQQQQQVGRAVAPVTAAPARPPMVSPFANASVEAEQAAPQPVSERSARPATRGSRPGTAFSRADTTSSAGMAFAGADEDDLDAIHELRDSQWLPHGAAEGVVALGPGAYQQQLQHEQQQRTSAAGVGSASKRYSGSGAGGAATAYAREAMRASVSTVRSSMVNPRRGSQAGAEEAGGDYELEDSWQPPTVAGRQSIATAHLAGGSSHARNNDVQQLPSSFQQQQQQQQQQQHASAGRSSYAWPSQQQQQDMLQAAGSSARVPAGAAAAAQPAAVLPATPPPVAAPAHAADPEMPASSMTTEKLSNILRFLDTVEQQASEEANAPLPPASAHDYAQDSIQQPSWAARPAVAPAARPYTPAPPSPAVTSATALTGQPAGWQRASQAVDLPAAAAAPEAAAAEGGVAVNRSTTHSLHAFLDHQEFDAAGVEQQQGDEYGMGDDGAGSVASFSTHSTGVAATAAGVLQQQAAARRRTSGSVSVGGVSTGSATKPAAHLAESVYDGVRNKLKRLTEEVKERDITIARLHRELECQQQRTTLSLAEAEARLQEAVGAARVEHEAALGRHLGFMDRLLADKDELSRQCAALTETIKGLESKHALAMSKLKEGWAAELKRQREGWAAAERIKREQWMESKTGEIKDITVKGLESEVQKLLAKHKAELGAVQAAAADEARRQLDIAAAQHELALRQLKERMLKDQEDAVERERVAAATRLREASERYEQQLQLQRMRLVSDNDLKLEALEAARKEDRRRGEEAASRAAAEAEERGRALAEEARKEREALRRAHDKQMEALREQYEAGQEGWRAALAERSRRELEEREATLRERMTRERDAQIEAIVARLEAESAVAREAEREEGRRREEAAAAKHVAAIKEAKKAEARLSDKLRVAVSAQQAAEERAVGVESTLTQLQRELDAKNSTIRWLESQVSAAKQDAAARENDLRSVGQQKEALQAQAVHVVQREKEAVEARLRSVMKELEEQRSRHAQEMDHVEARVKAAMRKKDESISALRDQVTGLQQQLAHTEAVLAAQQAELGAM